MVRLQLKQAISEYYNISGIIVSIKTEKGLKCFTFCVMNIENMNKCMLTFWIKLQN